MAYFNVGVGSGGGGSSSFEIVSWADGTDAQIVAMVEAADRGEINLADYWSVGDERIVHLSAMSGNLNAASSARASAEKIILEDHVAQDATMVLMNVGGKILNQAVESGRTECSFIVGMKNGLANGAAGEFGCINPDENGDLTWMACARRTWCNKVFYNAIPDTLRSIFKYFQNSLGNQGQTWDYFALSAEKEVFGSNPYGSSVTEANLMQFTYYATESNRIKKKGSLGTASNWWLRSFETGANFCFVNSIGNSDYQSVVGDALIAPFGCI